MDIKIYPSIAKGAIYAPSSKSYAHRLMICASLAKGNSVIDNIGTNDDILATISCLRELGARIDINGTKATVKGIEKNKKNSETELFCNESGSTLRFLIPISLLFFEKTYFSGKGKLMERPQSVYEKLFEESGCYLEKLDNRYVGGGELKSGVFKIPGNVSSQFITGLLFVLPLLNGDSEIVLTSPLESAPYVDITIDALLKFGVEIKKTQTGFFVKGYQQYVPCNISVEGDWSNAAFLDAFNLIGGDVAVKGLDYGSLQGDKIYRGFYTRIKDEVPELDITDCPDLGPVLIALASINNGAVLTGTKRLKIKESDRGLAMKTELKKFGVPIEINENNIVIPKTILKAPEEPLCCHNDHRIAMSLAVICSKTGGYLTEADCVKKSYPEFFDDIKKLGIKYEIL